MFRRGLGDPAGAERSSTTGASRALYRALIEPVQGDLSNVTHLIVSPDDALALIPFEALLTRDLDAGSTSPGPGSYLVERFSVSYAPSATVLASLRQPARANVVVALGDPMFGPDTSVTGTRGPAPGQVALAALPNTAAEVEALRTLSGSRRFVGLTGAEATRGRLLGLPELPEAGLLHLATHGVADENEPGRSGLWLAASSAGGAGPAPGFLSVDDILGLRLHAELVTLSACETGLGRLERGEGVLGLTRAFLAAGARSVVVSLWRVNDRSTALLMEGFYRALLQRGLPREEALAESKRALLAAAETHSPYYWAPFVLVGGGGKLR
jgi:CHAT domain-containing protein